VRASLSVPEEVGGAMILGLEFVLVMDGWSYWLFCIWLFCTQKRIDFGFFSYNSFPTDRTCTRLSIPLYK